MSATNTAVCPICGGTRFKVVQTSPYRVGVCDCARAERIQSLLKKARIPPQYAQCTFTNFDRTFAGSDPSLQRAMIFARGFLEKYPLEDRGLVFVGPIGVGKTHLAVATMKGLIEQKGVQCLFYDYRDLLREIRSSYSASALTTEEDVLRPALEVPVLVLDELGAERTTDWVSDTVSHILNTRYNNKKTTIFTTNFPDEPSAGSGERQSVPHMAAREETLGDRITDRMWSRLHEVCHFIQLQGPDFRLRKARTR